MHIAFVDNDLPGIMLGSVAEMFLARYGVAVGSSAVVFGCHDRIYATARRLYAAGIYIAAAVDTRSFQNGRHPADLAELALRLLLATCLCGGT